MCDAGLIVRAFTSDADLELELFHALTAIPRPGPLAVRYSLPPDTAAFTGRDGELDRITAAVTGAVRAGGLVAIHAIDGMPGVGKTALAVHVAHLLQDRFPDRQLFIDLHGHTPGQDPVPPEVALAGLLTAVGVDARYLPEDLEGRTNLWRDRMAGTAKWRRSTRWGRCTESAPTSAAPLHATGRRWTWPARSAAPGMRLMRWPGWAAVPWPPAAPPTRRPACGRREISSSGSVRPRPPE